jgi:hypothetical protein
VSSGECPACHGNGEFLVWNMGGDPPYPEGTEPCTFCHGTGRAKPEDIPQDIWDAAEAIWNAEEIGSDRSAIEIVARAVIADRLNSPSLIQELIGALSELRHYAQSIVGASTSDDDAQEAFDMYFAAQKYAHAVLVKAGAK